MTPASSVYTAGSTQRLSLMRLNRCRGSRNAPLRLQVEDGQIPGEVKDAHCGADPLHDDVVSNQLASQLETESEEDCSLCHGTSKHLMRRISTVHTVYASDEATSFMVGHRQPNPMSFSRRILGSARHQGPRTAL
jgi:tRNA U54 and U55 pseudouridine synthase Pus10